MSTCEIPFDNESQIHFLMVSHLSLPRSLDNDSFVFTMITDKQNMYFNLALGLWSLGVWKIATLSHSMRSELVWHSLPLKGDQVLWVGLGVAEDDVHLWI